ncbi:hypothetical protein, partial [Defluviitalea phaphyphila]|uniref:hypothetical protein n=1 Tax=Defluviitalea phaphyphila TaxID=1473580 RepID=UPI001365A1A0
MQGIANKFEEFSEIVRYNTEATLITMKNIWDRNIEELQTEKISEGFSGGGGSSGGAGSTRSWGETEKEEIPEEVEILCDVTKMASTGRAYYSGK